MDSTRISGTAITICIGDIVKETQCDGVVLSATENLRPGAGVSGLIHQAAGPELEGYCKTLAPLPLGQAISTPGFLLRHRVVIHTRGPRYYSDPDPAKHLAEALTNAILLADHERVYRVVVPAISMGGNAYPPDEASPILMRAAFETSFQLRNIDEIWFMVTSRCMERLLFGALKKIMKE